MSSKKLTKKVKEQEKLKELAIQQAYEQARLRIIAYEKTVDDRVNEIMALTLEEQEQKIREFVIADDDRKIRERELVDQLRDCVTMLESVRRDGNSDSDTELEDLHARVLGV